MSVIGKKFKVKGVMGKVTSAKEGCQFLNGMPSIVNFTTPHGTVIETGIAYLEELTPEEGKKLMQHELDALKKGKLYNQDVIKIGVVCDNYKLEYFKRKFKEAGFDFQYEPFQFNCHTIQITAKPDQVDDVKRVITHCELHFKRSN